MYHPADPTSGSYTSDDFQFIELKNTSATQTLSLSGVRFTDGVAFDFSGSSVTSLAPGAQVLVVSNLAAFQSRYGTGFNGIIAGQFAKQNPTDLEHHAPGQVGRENHARRFRGRDDPQLQLPGRLVQADRRQRQFAGHPRRRGRRPRACGASAKAGSPAMRPTARRAPMKRPPTRPMPSSSTNSSRIAPTNPAPWAIGSNSTTPPSSPINIGGWYLSNDDGDLKKFQIAAGTVIPANGYKAFNWRDNFGSTANAGCMTPFTFGELGGNVYLTSAVAGALTDFQANESFGVERYRRHFRPLYQEHRRQGFRGHVEPDL